MNARFWQLVEQADDEGGDDPDIRDEVFAKLIVRDLIDSMIKRYGDDDELPIQEIEFFVKEHFGVKE